MPGLVPGIHVFSCCGHRDVDGRDVPGGFPITVTGQVVGAVAAGGATIEQDVIVAQAALAALAVP